MQEQDRSPVPALSTCRCIGRTVSVRRSRRSASRTPRGACSGVPSPGTRHTSARREAPWAGRPPHDIVCGVTSADRAPPCPVLAPRARRRSGPARVGVPPWRRRDRGPRGRRQLRAAPARHVGERSSRQRPGAARPARARRVGVSAPARRPRGALALALGVLGLAASGEACTTRARSAPRATTTPGCSRSRPACRCSARRRDALAVAPRGRRRPRRYPAARCSALRALVSSCSSSCRSAWPTSTRTSARAVVPAARPRRAHEDVSFETSDGLDAARLVRAVAQRRRRDRLPGPQGPAGATRGCSPATATACCSSTAAARARATATRRVGLGRRRATSRPRSRSSGAAPTSIPTASAGSGCRSAAR